MRKNDIENWALSVIDRVRAHQPVEDMRVELKTIWPDDPRKAARRIAGHANAARGEPILWLIGVDEGRGLVPGADFAELSSWHSAVVSAFDELAPDITPLNIPVDGVTIVALYFETDRAPYVVKAAEGGAIQREVPWREATGIRSATRGQLLRLLTPLQRKPQAEVIGALAYANEWNDQEGHEFVGWRVDFAFFVTQPSGQETVFPSHACNITLHPDGSKTIGPFQGGLKFRANGEPNVHATQHIVSITGSGIFEAHWVINVALEEDIDKSLGKPLLVDITLSPVNAELHPIVLHTEIPSRVDLGGRSTWAIGRYGFPKS